ncbi:hypothetical protein TrRE_jg6371 [Triparma retinervis]|uniref:Uncharacterized protein n=1 Tax=Triparma retinervis TaxID=2557542 RepID=A0A9W7DRM5_9STRA|nr:hypothetical protein TrRE_jg6371 [Triparma retinervis]
MDSGDMASPFNAANVIKQLRSRKSSIVSTRGGAQGPLPTGHGGPVRSAVEELNAMVSVSAKQEKARKAEERSIKMGDGGGKFEEDELDFYRRLIIKGGEGGGGEGGGGEGGRAKPRANPQARKAERSKHTGSRGGGGGDDDDSDSSWSDYDEEEENLRIRGERKEEEEEEEEEEEGGEGKEEEEEEGGGGFKDQLKGLVGKGGGGGDGFDSDSLDFDTSTDSEPASSRPKNQPIQYDNPFDDFADDLSDDLADLSDPEDNNPNENVNPGPLSIAAFEDEIDEAEIKRIYEERLARAGIKENKMDKRATSPEDSPSKKRFEEDANIDFSKSLPSPLKMKQQQQQQQQQQRSRLRDEEDGNFELNMKPGQRMRIIKKSKLTRRGEGGKRGGPDSRAGFKF